MVRFAEWYMVAHDSGGLVRPNVGLRLQNTDLGRGIADRSQGINWQGCVADPAIFAEHGGPSIYDQMKVGARQRNHALLFSPADNNRIAGWQKFRDMLDASSTDNRETAGMWVFDTCTNFIRTVPVLQASKLKPDDVDTDGEDHAGDEARYAVMSSTSGGSISLARTR
jgi:hypothetical protein